MEERILAQVNIRYCSGPLFWFGVQHGDIYWPGLEALVVVGSIIATGEERGGKGRGGKEDIYVLLTEWRRKLKKIKCMQGQKDREWTQILSMHKGLVSLWQEAISTCSYTTCLILPVASDLHGLLLNWWDPGSLGYSKGQRGSWCLVDKLLNYWLFLHFVPAFKFKDEKKKVSKGI